MAYKKIDKYFSFADIAIQNNADKNRSLIFLQKINKTIDWLPIEILLQGFYKHCSKIYRILNFCKSFKPLVYEIIIPNCEKHLKCHRGTWKYRYFFL